MVLRICLTSKMLGGNRRRKKEQGGRGEREGGNREVRERGVWIPSHAALKFIFSHDAWVGGVDELVRVLQDCLPGVISPQSQNKSKQSKLRTYI